MADRATRVTLTVNAQNYVAGMNQARTATEGVTTASQSLSGQNEARKKVGDSLLVIGTAAAVGVGAAIKAFADFDAQMSQVQTLSHATAEQMGVLREAALTAGQGIGFSANEVADAETELIKAGVSVKDIMGGGLTGALNLAAAGQIDVADATSIAAAALTQFGLAGKDVPHVADLLAAGADKALGGVSELGQALGQSGLVAHQFGLTVDQTVGTLAEFAQNGLLGSDAGTSLKQMFLQLASPSKQAQAAMDAVGFSAYDAQGKFVGITNLADQLKTKFSGLSEQARNSAFSIIFGSDAIRSANILYKDGAKGNQAWIDSVNDSGFAATQASGKMDNLNGDLKKLQSAFQSGLIEAGSNANGTLRTLTQTATGLIGAFTSTSPIVSGIALGLGALTAVAALTGGAFLTIVPKVRAAQLALSEMNVTGKSLALTMGKGAGIGLALVALSSGVAALGSQATLTSDQLAQLNNASKLTDIGALNKLFTAGGGLGDAVAVKTKGIGGALDYLTDSANKANIGVGKFVDGLSFGLIHGSDTAKRFQAQFSSLGTQLGDLSKTDLPSATTEFNKLVKASGGGSDAVKKLLEVMPDYKAALIDQATSAKVSLSNQDLLNLAQGKGAITTKILGDSTKTTTDATDDAAVSLDKVSTAAVNSTSDLDTLEKKIKGLGSDQLDLNSTTRDYQAAIDAVTQSVKDNGRSFDVTTDKGRANQSAVDDIASSTLALASATLQSTHSQDDAAKAISNGRDQLVAALGQFGITGQAAQDYADKVGLIPSKVYTQAYLDTQNANAAAAALDARITALTQARRIPVEVDLTGTGVGTLSALTAHGKIAFAKGGIADYYADGGVAENHVAQIAPAGAMRLWAEPETGGEAYIPLGASKRSRSLSIWEETGKRLNAFASGGFTPAYSPGSGAASVNVSPAFNVIVSSKGGIDFTKYVDVAIERYDDTSKQQIRQKWRQDS